VGGSKFRIKRDLTAKSAKGGEIGFGAIRLRSASARQVGHGEKNSLFFLVCLGLFNFVNWSWRRGNAPTKRQVAHLL